MSYSPWTVSKPVLWPVVIRDNDFPAVGLCGEPGGEGTLDALRAHPSPAAGDSLNLSGPMAAREPVSFPRVKFRQEPLRGLSERLLSVASAFHEQKPIDGKSPCQNQNGADPYRNSPSVST